MISDDEQQKSTESLLKSNETSPFDCMSYLVTNRRCYIPINIHAHRNVASMDVWHQTSRLFVSIQTVYIIYIYMLYTIYVCVSVCVYDLRVTSYMYIVYIILNYPVAITNNVNNIQN